MSTQAGPSSSSGSQVRTQPPKSVGRTRKAGGEGKKGKIFLEDKAGLLSLMNDVTSTKDDLIESRLAKLKGQPPAATDKGKARASDDAFKVSIANAVPVQKKRRVKEKALADAKAALVAEEKARKRRKKAGSEAQVEQPTKKKSVGFA